MLSRVSLSPQEAYMKAIDKTRFAPLLEGPMGDIAKGGAKGKPKH